MLHSFLAEMRQQKLDPWLDGEGYIHIAYVPEQGYFDYLKANKHYTVPEFAIEAKGVNLGAGAREAA